MRDFVIMTDSCCDLPADLAEELELTVLPLCLHMEGRDYYNWLDGRDLDFRAFYEKLRGGVTATTAAVSVGAFQTEMRRLLKAGKDILCICFSSALSTTYQSAVIAAGDLRAEFPEAKISVVDSLSASMGQGLLLYLCAQEKRKGKSLEEVRDFAEKTKGHVCHWFTVDDLNHLKRGGRISPATALLGTMLSIKPVLHVDAAGCLVPVSKIRGRKASLSAMVDRMEALAVDPAEQTVMISHGDCLEDAQFTAEEIRRRLGTRDIRIHYIGPVIGNHAGPGTVALFFLGRER